MTTFDITYPADLPVSQRRDDLLAAIRAHQVVVVAGETGSGKTTQLPKMCLELGRGRGGREGMIGHTQPRRIAARAVAERVAEELGTELGSGVGYTVRFTDKVAEETRLKVMTDGILLAEIRRDRMLRRYDTIIIDEAHERSLNIDFLLGYLKRLLPRRPDLKLIITSATIDPQRFADYFDGAPVIEVSGRTYPVEVRYRPIGGDGADGDPKDADQVGAVCDAVRELWREPAGDVLVFLSGEREIRDTADALEGMKLVATEILPLYARLSAAEQHRVFAPHAGRRIVLATNVAETSLTVPGIKYVIDAGTARISRFSNRTKVQLLPIEPISQASAKQRSGRCGRTSDGICIRLYSEDDFHARPEFTDPEILRTNLASVLLQMAVLDLGDIDAFGFIDPPDRRQVSDGLALLAELGALDERRKLTKRGRRIAELPVDPRIARMILEAGERACVREVLVLAAAMTIQDPRERPVEHQAAADASHQRFVDPASDFVTFLNLWKHIREQQKALSSSQFRKMCRTEYLSYLRVREWQDLYSQLRRIASSMGVRIEDAPGDRDQVHRSLLSGLLSHIGQRDPVNRDYLGARGARFAIFPGSALFRKQPDFVMAAELVQTSRLWARVNAGVQSEWAEELADHLVKRTYSEPRWSRRRAAVVATERVTLYGVVLVAGRTVGFHTIDPELSRDLFIRHALVEGDWDTRHHFFRDNQAVLAEARELEERSRRRDIVVDDQTVFEFYDKRVPPSCVSGRHFDSWWKKARHQNPKLLTLTHDDLVRPGADNVSDEQFPDRWSVGSFDLELSYRFDPATPDDGVTVEIPLASLPAATSAGLDWQVPGMRAELVSAWLRTLPKTWRREVVPVPDTAAALVARLPDQVPDGRPLTSVLADELRSLRGVVIPPDAWDESKLPGHLRPMYRIVDEAGAELGRGKDLAALQKQFAAEVSQTFARATSDLMADGLTSFDLDELPKTIMRTVAGHELKGYPAFVDQTAGVGIRVLDTPQAQRHAMRLGMRRLLMLAIPPLHKQLANSLSQKEKLTLSRAPYASPSALLDDVIAAAIDVAMARAGGPQWTRPEYERLREAVVRDVPKEAAAILKHVSATITAYHEVELAVAHLTAPSLVPVREEITRHLASLVHPGFVSSTPAEQLQHLPRFVSALRVRAEDAASAVGRDRERAAQLEGVRADLAELRARPVATNDPDAVENIRWMIEELAVSLFAQKLGTSQSISVARVHKAMDRIDPR